MIKLYKLLIMYQCDFLIEYWLKLLESIYYLFKGIGFFILNIPRFITILLFFIYRVLRVSIMSLFYYKNIQKLLKNEELLKEYLYIKDIKEFDNLNKKFGIGGNIGFTILASFYLNDFYYYKKIIKTFKKNTIIELYQEFKRKLEEKLNEKIS